MNDKASSKIFYLPEFHNRIRVFRDRTDAGKVLASMLESYRNSDAVVLAIPAGGVAVAEAIATALQLILDVAVVSKITLPWNTEVGYGAVAFDGTVMLNEEFLLHIHLSEEEIQEGISKTTEKVARRVKTFRRDRPLPDIRRYTSILVDDGLASGFTLRVAIRALRNIGCQHIILAVPTAHEDSVQRIIGEVEAMYCPNLRGGPSFAVADAYKHWRDLSEQEVIQILAGFNSKSHIDEERYDKEQ